MGVKLSIKDFNLMTLGVEDRDYECKICFVDDNKRDALAVFECKPLDKDKTKPCKLGCETDDGSCSGHHHYGCLECMRGYIRNRVGESDLHINCPTSDCFGKIEPRCIERILTRQGPEEQNNTELDWMKVTLDKFHDFHQRTLLAQDPDYRVCLTPNCKWGFLRDPDGTTRFKCGACQKIYCSECKIEWPQEHNNKTCAVYKEWLANQNTREKTQREKDNQASEAVIRKKCKKCP